MADNVAITAGAGTTVATDDVSAVHYQRVKLADGTAYSATEIRAAAGTAANALRTTLASDDPAVVSLQLMDDWDNGASDGASVSGDVAHDAVEAGEPVKIGGRAQATAPTDVSADNDRVNAWFLRNGAAATVITAAGALVGGDATNGLDVDVTRLSSLVAGSANIGQVDGTIAHDGIDSGNPHKIGMRALAHGTNPTAVAAADRTDWLANRAGVPWVIGGHPNIVCLKHTTITTAVTDAAVVTIGAGLKIVVTSFMFTLDNASTVFPTVLLGFGAVNTPTTTGVIGAHGGVPAGGGFGRGDGSGIIGVGADGEDLRVTTTGNATGNGLQLVVSYYTIES